MAAGDVSDGVHISLDVGRAKRRCARADRRVGVSLPRRQAPILDPAGKEP